MTRNIQSQHTNNIYTNSLISAHYIFVNNNISHKSYLFVTEPTSDANNNSCDFDLAAYLSVLLQIYGDTECDCDNSQSVLPLFDNNDKNEFRDMYHDLMDEYKKNSNYVLVSILMNFITILGVIAYILSRNKPRDQSIYDSVKPVDSDYDDDK